MTIRVGDRVKILSEPGIYPGANIDKWLIGKVGSVEDVIVDEIETIIQVRYRRVVHHFKVEQLEKIG